MSTRTIPIKDAALHNKALIDAKWNADGSLLAVVSADKAIRLFQFDKTKTAFKLQKQIPLTYVASQLAWHPQISAKLCVISEEKMVDVFDVNSADLPIPQKIMTLGGNINASWSPDGKYLAIGNKSDNVIVYEAVTGKQLKKHRFSYGE